FIFGCREDEDVVNTPPVVTDSTLTVALSGYIQKGPFINGTAITISELDSTLTTTGKNFTTQIADNKGSFSIKNLQLQSPYVQLQANGFYFDEVKGEKSIAQLTLFALSQVENVSSVNANLLSHMERTRVIYLMQEEAKTFAEAKIQAQQEILAVFNIAPDSVASSEQLDISQAGEGNAILLAISAVLQANNSVAELSELAANIMTDLREDGTLDSQTNKNKIREQATLLNLAQIRTNLEQRYETLGVTVSIPAFEQYIDSDGDGILNQNEDDNPDDFAFPPQTAVAIDTTVSSNTVKLTGLKEGGTANVRISNGSLVLNGKVVEDTLTQVKNGDQLQLRLKSSSVYADTVKASLAIGTVIRHFQVVTDDYIPDAFSFIAQKDVAVDSSYTSNAITVSGLPYPTPAKVANGILIKNGEEITGDSTSVVNGDVLAIQLPSSAEFDATTSATLDINGVNADFEIITDDYIPDTFAFESITNAKRYTAYSSDTITITGLPHPTPMGTVQVSYDGSWRKYIENAPENIVPLRIFINDIPHNVDDKLRLSEGDQIYLSAVSSQKGFDETITARLTINSIDFKFQITTESNPWQKKIDYPGSPWSGDDFTTLFASEGKIFAGGNYTGEYDDELGKEVFSQELYVFDNATNQWEVKTKLPSTTGSYRTPAFTLEKKAYIVINSELWKYDITENKWSKINSAPIKLYAATNIGSKGYFMGDGELWEYDVTINNWSKKASPPINSSTVFSSNGNLLVVLYQRYLGKGTVWEYTPQSDSWLQKSDIQEIQRMATTQVTGFVIKSIPYLVSDEELLMYNKKEDKWKSLDYPYPYNYDSASGLSTPTNGYLFTGKSWQEFTPPQE
ncbi:MAG: hypothetical protein RIG62_22760, partial [Cyclobacteriaceae bacterium]